MEYRISEPDDFECETEDEEFEYLHEHVQTLMHHASKDEIVDTLLILSNICDARTLLNPHDARLVAWNARLRDGLKHLLEDLTSDPEVGDVALPNEKLENPLLYFDMRDGTMH